MAIRFTDTLAGLGPDDFAGGFWVGWPTPPSPTLHYRMLEGSEAFVLAVDDEVPEGTPRVAGFVNAVGDGVFAAFIPCLEVLPAYQGRGIGSELVGRLLARLEDRYSVDLVCDDDVVPFYERLGLQRWNAMLLRRRAAIAAANERLVEARP
jgi:ribosomal protein S18 acetylase RimI-like enzyme